MKRVLSIAVFSLLLILISNSAFGAKRYWIKATAGKWNNTANWSSTSGGAGGSSVPGASDTAYFDGNGTGNDTLDMNVSVKYLNVAAGYTGKIVQGTYTVTIGTTGAVLAGGTFEGGSASITLTGALTISGCAFTSSSGTLTTNSNITVSSGSFNHNSGTIEFTSTMTLTSTITGGVTFYNFTFAPTAADATFTITSTTTINVNGSLSIAGTKSSTFNTGTLNLKGHLTASSASSALGGGSATFVINGTGTQTITGNSTSGSTRLPNLSINKSSGTLYFSNVISVAGNWTYTSGTIAPQTSTVYMLGTKTISGSMSFKNLSFAATSATYTISTGSILGVDSTLSISGGGVWPIFNTGAIHARGNINLNTTNTGGGGGSATLVINGTSNQNLTGHPTGFSRLCNVEINKASGTLNIQNKLLILGNWNYVSGTVVATGSTIEFNGSRTITGSHHLDNVILNGSSSTTITVTTGTTLTIESSLTISGGSNSLVINNGTIHLLGNLTVTNLSTSGTGGTSTLVINGTASQTLTGSGTANAGKLCNLSIDKTSGTLNLASVISVNGNWNYIKGDVAPGTSTVGLYGTFQLDGQEEGTNNMMPFYNLGIGSGTRTLTGNIDINKNFTILSGATCSANGKNMNVGGNWNCQGTFTYSTGTVTFDGNSYNNIKGTAGTTVGFGNVAFNRGAGSVTLQNPMRVNTSMTITEGRIKTTSANYLEFVDNATCTTATHSAYVHGPVRKTGNDAFTFPLGDTTLNDTAAFHPLAITAPGATGDQFEAVYYASGQTLGDSLVDTLDAVSNCEYWTIARNSGTSSVYVTTYWNVNSCIVEEFDGLRASQWDGNKWLDLGASNISVFSGGIGSITTLLPPSFIITPVPIAIATKHGTIPYATLQRKLDGTYYNVGNGALRFKYDEEYQDADSKLQFTIYTDARNYPVSSSSNMGASLLSSIVTYYGDNRYSINIAHCSITPAGYLPSGFYVLEVVNEKNEKRYLRFKHTNTLIYNNCMPNNQGQ